MISPFGLYRCKKSIKVKFWLSFLFSFSFSCVALDLQEYQLGPGDMIGVSVYGEPDLSLKTKISKAGTIDMPLVGSVSIEKKTVEQVRDLLVSKFKDGYLVSPQVIVVVEEYRPFFIYGAVRLSGSFKYQADLTVEQAITLAGGLKERASNSEWYIVRDGQRQEHKAEKGTMVFPGDVIKIEQSLF